MKPTAKVVMENMSDAKSLLAGKYACPMAALKYPNIMKSYISRKLPLATRNTVLTFSLRCSAVSMHLPL
jgi:hypothetical protein